MTTRQRLSTQSIGQHVMNWCALLVLLAIGLVY
jgi:hypothetical protein